MQKWLPDAFTPDAPVVASMVGKATLEFESGYSQNTNALDAATDPSNGNRLFMSESGFSGPEAIMSHLTSDERAQVFELVEQDITRKFRKREEKLKEELVSDLDKARQDFQKTMDTWSENLENVLAAHLKKTADMSVRLAFHLAEKNVRTRVQCDQEILVRALETTLFKVDGDKKVIVNVNPDQVELLESQDKLKERLGIHQVVADRRVDAGGCLVRTEKMEWDATIKSQLEYLGELVEEMIATGDQPDLTGKGESPDDPGLD
jgi:flagellar biosynthesis/type III secretory pathway protein FliH